MIKEEIIKFLMANTGIEKEELLENPELVTSGILDSLLVVSLVDFIEKKFGIDLLNVDFDLANFETVDTIETLIMHYKEKR